MRMAIHPGRGGRGVMLNRKPRYLMLDPPNLPFGNQKIDHGNPYGVLRTQFSDYEMKRPHDDERNDQKDENSLEEQIHMEKIPDSNQKCQERSGAPKSVINKAETLVKYMEAIREAKKKKKFKSVKPGKYHIKKTSSLLEESENLKISKVRKFNHKKMEIVPLRNDDVVMENVETEAHTKTAEKRKSIMDEVEDEDDDMSELTPRKTTSAFSPTFFPDPDDIKRAKKVTPEKDKNDSDNVQEGTSGKTISNLIQIIQNVAESINIQINHAELEAMKNWDVHALRKKLGDFNSKKKFMNSPPIATFDHKHQEKHNYTKEEENIYDKQGLNAAAVSITIQPQEAIVKNKPPQVKPVTKKKNPVKSQIRHSYTARLRLSIRKFNSVNVGFVLKQMFQLWKEADASIILLAHNEEDNTNLWIDDVNKIPDEKNMVDKYVAGVYQYHDKLHFSLRFSGHQELQKMKLKIFAWMKSNDSFATIDKVRAALVHTIGFFYKIHPDFYNREELKKDVHDHLKELNIGDDVNIFPRKIWIRTNEGKVETRALAMEVPKNNRDVVNRHMMKFQYKTCKELMYVPFSNMNDDVYKQTLKEIFYGQNIYLHTTRRRTIYGIRNANTIYPTKGGEATSFREWIKTITYGENEFLEACEIGPTGNIHLIFNQEYDQTVQQLFGQGFKKFASENFHEENIQKIFTNERVQMDVGDMKTAEDMEYAEMLKRKFGNPQESMNQGQTVTANKTYAEASREPPTKLTRINLHYSKFSRPTTLRTNTYQGNETSQRNKDNASKGDDQGWKSDHEQVLSNEWMKDMEQRLTEKINDYREDFDAKLSALEKQTQARMEKSEEMILGKLQEMQVKTTEDIKESFNVKMNNVDHKFDLIMNMLTKQTGSTGPNNTTESVNGPGKGQ